MKLKRMTVLFCLCFMVVNFVACASEEVAPPAEKGDVAISFDYVKQGGYATNQFAVWIEDTQGNVIKPLFVTKFTGNGGWKRRPDSLPDWVSRIGQDDTIDGMTGSTPKAGYREYVWDCTDTSGNRVAEGSYLFFVEASLRWANRALFKGEFVLGGDSFTESASPKYFGEDTEDRGMIKNVSATLVE